MQLTANQQVTPPQKQNLVSFGKKVIVLLLFVSLSFMSYGQYISTSSSSYSGDIYHTKGKLGIGTTNPQTLLHLRVEHNNFSYFPTIRLENFYPKSQ